MRLHQRPNRDCVYNEPIAMKERRHGYIPQAFLWHGHCYRIHAVDRCWTVLRRRPSVGRLCFRVRCAEGTFELCQNLPANTWHLHKAQWNKRDGRSGQERMPE